MQRWHVLVAGACIANSKFLAASTASSILSRRPLDVNWFDSQQVRTPTYKEQPGEVAWLPGPDRGADVLGDTFSSGELRSSPLNSQEEAELTHMQKESQGHAVSGMTSALGLQPRHEEEEVTDTGQAEAPTTGDGVMAKMNIFPDPVVPKTLCSLDCKTNELCWSGECIYRPWKTFADPRNSCYPDPEQPGLERDDKLVCRGDSSTKSKEDCESAASYCRWLSDAPDWYRDYAMPALPEWNGGKRPSGLSKMLRDAARELRPGNPTVNNILESR